jgi:hypothetical protein
VAEGHKETTMAIYDDGLMKKMTRLRGSWLPAAP